MPEILDFDYVILGAGPSGLTFAHRLLDEGETSFIVIEAEEEAGGLCRSAEVDGAPLDIGGGHFLDVKNARVTDFLFRFLSEDQWNRYSRITRIRIAGFDDIDYPFESHIYQLSDDEQTAVLDSIAEAGCVTGAPEPSRFSDWISWKLGDRIAEIYMLPYNRKIWSVDLDDLGAYWLHKLPDVSYEQTLQSCREKKPAGTVPAHEAFLYPRAFGYGEVWRRMGDQLGENFCPGTKVTSVDVEAGVVNDKFRGKRIINTIPWPLWRKLATLPGDVAEAVDRLRHTSVDVDYVGRSEASDAHWIYIPDEDVPHHRLLCRNNFIAGARGGWTETNSARSGPPGEWRHHNTFAYPLNTIGKPREIELVLTWARSQEIYGLGRWGEW
ncbi:MAG: NAD(P)-binding protein, partial [Alphaproteobacteria bacterium]|nr:NAD(P)-binding protein [Alphaproteobacteria bacterium]